MPDHIQYPDPDDFDINENELASGDFSGSFQIYPAEAFRQSITTRTFMVPFDDPLAAYGTLPQRIERKLGTATCDLQSEDREIVRFLPEVDFHFRHLVAARVDFKALAYRGLAPLDHIYPEPDAGTLPPMASSNLYEWLMLRVHYAYPRFRLGDRVSKTSQQGERPDFEQDRFCTKEVKAGITYVTVRPGPFEWDDNSLSAKQKEINFPIPQVESYADLLVMWLGVPFNAMPTTAIDCCLGRINGDENTLDQQRLPDIPPPGLYDPETLLLQTYSYIDDAFADQNVAGDPSRLVHILYHFKHRNVPYGWNGYIFPGTATYKRVKRKGDGTGLFLKPRNHPINDTPIEFDDLFRPEPPA